MQYVLKVSAMQSPNAPPMHHAQNEPYMALNVGDYLTFGVPAAPPSAPNNGLIMKIRHAVYPGPGGPVCETWVLIDAAQ